MKRVDNIIKGAELMTDTTALYKWDAPWYCATPVPSLYRLAAKYAPDLGIDESRFSFGALPKASSDLGCVAYKIPSVEITFPIVGEDEPAPVGHADETAAITEMNFLLIRVSWQVSSWRLQVTESEPIRKNLEKQS